MKRFSLLVAAALLAAPLGVVRAGADQRQVLFQPPYERAEANHSCIAPLLIGACTADTASASASSGAVALDEEASGPAFDVFGNAEGTFEGTLDRATPVAALAVIVTYDVTRAEVHGGSPISFVVQGLNRAFIAVTTTVEWGCSGCRMTSDVPIAQADLGESIPAPLPGRYSTTTVIAQQDGSPIPAGAIHISAGIRAGITLTGPGSAGARFDGTVVGIEVAAPSLERDIIAPYGAADHGASCGGGIGSTFTCRSAASRSSGRAEMDLGVVTPVAGTAPGSGDATGQTVISTSDQPAQPVRAIVYIVTLRIDRADAYASRRQVPTWAFGGGSLGASGRAAEQLPHVQLVSVSRPGRCSGGSHVSVGHRRAIRRLGNAGRRHAGDDPGNDVGRREHRERRRNGVGRAQELAAPRSCDRDRVNL